jgi:hypothetical protein
MHMAGYYSYACSSLDGPVVSAEEDACGPGGGVNSEDTPTTVVRELPETRRDLLGREMLGEVGDQENVREG